MAGGAVAAATQPGYPPAVGKRKRVLILGAMWAAALIAVVFIVLGQPPAEAPPPEPTSSGFPVRTPDDRAPGETRADLPVAAPPAGPPRTFRGDRRHTGRSAYRGPAEDSLMWTYETGGRITGQPVVDDAGRIYVGSHDGHLYALDSAGTLRWRKDLGGQVYATPHVDARGNVYAGSDGDAMWSFDARGEVRWRLPTDGDADTGVVEAPDGTLLFAAGQELWAVDADGAVQWKFRSPAKIYSTPAVDDDGTVYVGSQDDHLYALAPDGRPRWSYRTRGDNDSSPVIGDDGTIYFGSDDQHVYALTRDGRLRWSERVDGYVRGPVGLGLDGSVIAGVFGPRPRIVSLDAATGELRWFFPVTVADSAEIGVLSGPTIDRDGGIYVGAHDDHLYALTADGQLRWAFTTRGDVDSTASLPGDGVLYVGSDDGHLYALGRHQ